MKPLRDLIFDRPSIPNLLPHAEIDRIVAMCLRIWRRIPPLRLSSQEKMELGGYLFMEGPTIVEQVADGLATYRACFPEIQVDPADLKEGVMRTSRWQEVRQFGLMLVHIADCFHAVELAPRVKVALQVLRHVRADRQRMFPGPRDKDRAQAMAAAEDTLAAYRARVQRKAENKA